MSWGWHDGQPMICACRANGLSPARVGYNCAGSGMRVTALLILAVWCYATARGEDDDDDDDDDVDNDDSDDWDELPDFGEAEIDCPQHGDRFLPVVQVPWGTVLRAYLTTPAALRVGSSAIPAAGLGVFATTFIRRFTWLGEYDGEVIPDGDFISEYAWKVSRDDYTFYYIDAWNVPTSNWMRFVNCARDVLELNVEMLACRGKIFYMSRADLYPGDELLVYYGHDYAEALGIDTAEFERSGS